jgi:hypothetical protein
MENEMEKQEETVKLFEQDGFAKCRVEEDGTVVMVKSKIMVYVKTDGTVYGGTVPY